MAQAKAQDKTLQRYKAQDTDFQRAFVPFQGGGTKKNRTYLLRIVYLFFHVETSVAFKVLSICCNTPTETFLPTAQNSFLNLSILMPFSFCCFLFHLFHISKTFPLEDFFHPEKQKSLKGRDQVNREGGAWCHAIFGQELLNTQLGAGRCACKSPIMRWANTLKESSKKFTGTKCSLSQQRQLVH